MNYNSVIIRVGKRLLKTPTPFSKTHHRNGIVATFSTSTNNSSTSIPERPPSLQRSSSRGFKTRATDTDASATEQEEPGSIAFAECEADALTDLFHQFAKDPNDGGVDRQGSYLSLNGIRELLISIGEKPDEMMLRRLFFEADHDVDGKLHLQDFLKSADKVLGGAPARIVLVVGGPGSGKGILCDRLAAECGIVHLSSGNLLRDEVKLGTPLGLEVADIMARGELVSSAVITTLVRRRMRKFPGRRVLLDGFPRSLENAHDFLKLCGRPELALHLECDDTILMERIIKRMKEGEQNGTQRADDNISTGLQRLRTFHKYHKPTMDWLREQHVPIVNLDCTGTPEIVWDQLLAVGRLMRPVAKLGGGGESSSMIFPAIEEDNETDEEMQI